MRFSLPQLLAAPALAGCLFLLPASIARADHHNEFNWPQVWEEAMGSLIGLGLGGASTTAGATFLFHRKISKKTKNLKNKLEENSSKLDKLSSAVDEKLDKKEASTLLHEIANLL